MDDTQLRARLWAFYLPQFHPIPENDEWWGQGFTEWTNVKKAKPLFSEHRQPVVPGELGYYDLLKQPEIREKQAELAREYGIEGFIYWHYWFGGKKLLEKPFEQVLVTGKPDFPFALAWANESWRGFWHGLDNERALLIEQTYPGDEDIIAHFNYVLPALKDPRCLRVEGKPVFFVYRPVKYPLIERFIAMWRELAEKNGLPGIYFIGMSPNIYDEKSVHDAWRTLKKNGFDAVNAANQLCGVRKYAYPWKLKLMRWFLRNSIVHRIPDLRPWDKRNFFCAWDGHEDIISTVGAGWDHTPRTGIEGSVQVGFTPEKFEDALNTMIQRVEKKTFDKRIITVKSWNEWAEGNYLEPDQQWGRQILEAVKRAVMK